VGFSAKGPEMLLHVEQGSRNLTFAVKIFQFGRNAFEQARPEIAYFAKVTIVIAGD